MGIRTRRLVSAVLFFFAGLGLLLVASALIEGGHGGGEAARYEDEAELIEQRLPYSPEDPRLLLALVDARYHAAAQLVKAGSRAGSEEVLQQSRLASEAWSKYLEAGGKPNVSAAEAMEQVLAFLAGAAPDLARYREEMKRVAQTAELVARQAPSINAFMTVAYYRDFAFDWKAADRAAADALALARGGPKSEEVRQALLAYRQRAHETRRTLEAHGSPGEALE